MLHDRARNCYLAELAVQTRIRVSPFRWAQFNQPGRLASSHAEHEAMVVAVMRRDRERTALLMRRI